MCLGRKKQDIKNDRFVSLLKYSKESMREVKINKVKPLNNLQELSGTLKPLNKLARPYLMHFNWQKTMPVYRLQHFILKDNQLLLASCFLASKLINQRFFGTILPQNICCFQNSKHFFQPLINTTILSCLLHFKLGIHKVSPNQ